MIKRPLVRNDYSQNDLAKYLNEYLLELAIEVNKVNSLVLLSNYTATANPTTTDDDSKGYSVGSDWLNTSTGKFYKCLTNTTGAATWAVLN
jgi:hypothetical protein